MAGMTEMEERRLMEDCAAGFTAAADYLRQTSAADGILVAMSMGLAATRMLHALAPSPDMAMRSAEVFAQSALRAMADIVSGQDTETAGLQ